MDRHPEHIETWIFDLDLTLYGPEHNVMEQVRDRIATFVEDYFKVDSERAHQIRHDYWRKYGTTLGGLMAEHGVEPHGYLDFVHDVDLSLLKPCPQLRAGIDALPGRKLIFTNADAPYAQRVLKARGLDDMFEDMFDIQLMEHKPKPHPAGYGQMCDAFGINPEKAVFIEDSAHNLEPAKALGMTTIWINHDRKQDSASRPSPLYVDHQIHDLTEWLVRMKEPLSA